MAEADNAAATFAVGQDQTEGVGGVGDDVEAAGSLGAESPYPNLLLLPSLELVGGVFECGKREITGLARRGEVIGYRRANSRPDVRKVLGDSVPQSS